MLRRLLLPAIALLGLLLLAVALTAHLTGLDPEGNWGPARRQVFGAGLVALGATALIWLRPALLQAAGRGLAGLRSLARRVAQSRWGAPLAASGARAAAWVRHGTEIAARRVRETAAGSRLGRWAAARPHRPALLAATLIFGLAVPVAVWFVSVGFWSHWPDTGHYYNDLADAFRSGQLHLLESPSPALLALPDPYEFSQREHIAAPWDVVLYNGRFYLYWGPVPALLLAAWRSVSAGIVGDNFIVFASVLGTVLFTLLTLVEVWTARFRHLTGWALVPALLLAAFAHPLPWLLNRPAVYEASIAAAQCCLTAGIYLAIPVFLRGKIGRGRLFLAGVAWAGAVGSKASLSLAVAFWAAAAAALIAWRFPGTRRERALAIVTLGLPLVVGMAGLLGYNQARFHNPLDFGVRYQLTGLNLHRDFERIFAARNIPVNLYNYLFTSVRRLSVFPYIKPIWSSSTFPLQAWLTRHLPGWRVGQLEIYYPEQVTGLIYVFPFGGFALAAWARAARRGGSAPGSIRPSGTGSSEAGVPVPLVVALSLGAALAFLPSLTAAFATTRYMAEFMPSLLVLSALGAWAWMDARQRQGRPIGWLLALVWVTALASVTASLLLGVSGYDLRFERLNPELFDRIVRFLAP